MLQRRSSQDCPFHWPPLHIDNPKLTDHLIVKFCGASEVRFEPILTDAAPSTNVCYFEAGQKRDKIKGSFAKAL